MIHKTWLKKETVRKVKCVQTNAKKIHRKPRFNAGERI